MWKYSDKVYDHFMNPRNVGAVADPDGVGEVGSMACGDALRLSFKLDEDQRISEAKFQTFGCGSAIASSSILTEMIIGRTLEEAAKVTNEDIAEQLGGLPREKMHCSVMGREALEAAMIDYFKKQGKDVPCHLLTQGIMICHCYQVTRDTIANAIRDNRLQTVEDVTNFTKAGGGCGDCHHDIEELLRDVWARIHEQGETQKAATARPVIDLAQQALIERIEDLLSSDIASALRRDGGDIELVRVAGKRVFVRLTGACAACRASGATIEGWVEQQLRLHVDEELEVVEVKS